MLHFVTICNIIDISHTDTYSYIFAGLFGGGQNLTITGRGFNPDGTSATFCGEECVVFDELTTATELTCVTAANSSLP